MKTEHRVLLITCKCGATRVMGSWRKLTAEEYQRLSKLVIEVMDETCPDCE